MTLPQAALAAAIFLLGLAAFHGALALGAPWGAYVWGGQVEGRLSPRLQLGSTLLAPIVAAMAVVVLIRGGWLYPDEAASMVVPVWGVLLFLMTQMFGALRSESPKEKRRMTAVYVVGVALTAFMSFGTAG